MANSVMFVFPMMTAPFFRRFRMTGASLSAILSSNARLPAVVGNPATSILSLTRIGIPASGPSGALLALTCSASAVSISPAMQFNPSFPPISIAFSKALTTMVIMSPLFPDIRSRRYVRSYPYLPYLPSLPLSFSRSMWVSRSASLVGTGIWLSLSVRIMARWQAVSREI